VSPVEFIKQEGIRTAILLLKQPGISIKEVYTAYGFDSRSYFNRVFKQYKQQTPKALQQSSRLSPTTS
jgi:AraC-like DNA-binding protein